MTTAKTVSKKYWNPEKYNASDNLDEKDRLSNMLLLCKNLEKIILRLGKPFGFSKGDTLKEIEKSVIVPTYGDIMKLSRVYQADIVDKDLLKLVDKYVHWMYRGDTKQVEDWAKGIEFEASSINMVKAIAQILKWLDFKEVSEPIEARKHLYKAYQLLKAIKSRVKAGMDEFETNSDIESNIARKYK